MNARITWVVALVAVAGVARADRDEDARKDFAAVTAVVRGSGFVYADNKGHTIAFAMVPEDPGTQIANPWAHIFYGNAKKLALLVGTANNARTSPEERDAGIGHWDFTDRRYRVGAGNIKVDGKTATITCGDRTGTLKRVLDPSKLLAKATLTPPLASRSPYFLARDDGTTYFYVDRATEPVRNTDFHVYVGKRGALKKHKLKEIATDPAGDVFVTTGGTLRTTRGEKAAVTSATWTAVRKPAQNLVVVPRSDEIVYNDLGVYAGQKFGTPCDDF